MRQTRIFAIAIILWSSLGLAQKSITINSDPSDPSRPISTLLNQLRDREKIPVTYEDAQYTNSADIEDVTSEVARNMSPPGENLRPRILIPHGRAIAFVYSPRDLGTPEGVEATLSRMLREYEALGGGGAPSSRSL